jgi:hypothetical protein
LAIEELDVIHFDERSLSTFVNKLPSLLTTFQKDTQTRVWFVQRRGGWVMKLKSFLASMFSMKNVLSLGYLLYVDDFREEEVVWVNPFLWRAVGGCCLNDSDLPLSRFNRREEGRMFVKFSLDGLGGC